MDDSLTRLERELRANPDDKDLALMYYAALRRSGKKLEPLSGDRFEFECSKRWYELARTGKDYVRYCIDCKKSVYFAANEQEFDEHAKAGHCVSILQSKLDPLFDKIPSLSKGATLPLAQSSCLVLADWQEIAVEAADIAAPHQFNTLGMPPSPNFDDLPTATKEYIKELGKEELGPDLDDVPLNGIPLSILLSEAKNFVYQRLRKLRKTRREEF